MRTFVDVVFVLAWAVIGFAAVRALVLIFITDRRTAGLAAVAAACAFALGAWSPFALHGSAPAAPDAPAAPAGAPAAESVPSGGTRVGAHCTGGAATRAPAARGAIDTVAVGGASPAPPAPVVVTSAGERLRFAGWVALQSGAATSACVVIDGRVVATTGVYGVDRPDVAAALGSPAYRAPGVALAAAAVPGEHRVTLGAVASDGSVHALAQTFTVRAP